MEKNSGEEKFALPNHRLREARENRSMSQQELAEAIEVPDTRTIGRWERGISFPRHHYRRKLCEFFCKTPVELGFIESNAANSRLDEESVSESIKSNSMSEQIKTENIIPSLLTSFIGRDAEIARCCAL